MTQNDANLQVDAGAEALTIELATWIAQQRTSELPAEIRHHVRRLVVDHMAGVIPGSADHVTQAVAAHVAENYGGNEATAVGFGRMSPLGAALVNGTSAHGLELDDGYTPGSVHPSAPVIPAVFAAAQKHGADADTVVRAIAVGVEVVCRIAAAGHPATRRRGFHNTAVAGVFGAAAGSCVVMGLDVAEVAGALGVAGSHAGGLFEFLGQSCEIKRIHPGKAARDGLAGAQLAARGVSGPATVLEGDNGYFAAFAGDSGRDWDPATVTSGLGVNWALLGTYVKPYPCCRHLHGAVDAVLDMRTRDGFDPSQIATITVGTYAVATHHGHTVVDTVLDAQMSLPFAVAAALTYGRLTGAEFDESIRGDEQIARLMSVTSVVLDEAHDGMYPKARPATVTVSFSDGTSIDLTVLQPYGEPSNPVSDDALTDKFRSVVAPLLGSAATEALVQEIWNFSDLDFLDRVTASLG